MMAIQEKKKRTNLAFILLCLTISFTLFFGFYYLSLKVPNKDNAKHKEDKTVSSVSKESSTTQQDEPELEMDKKQKELKNKLVVEDEKKFAFKWTLDNFVELKIAKVGEWKNNPTLEEVITKYGKGSNVSFTENGLTLTYKTRVMDIEKNSLSDHPQEIRLGFFDPDSNGKEYYLITKSALFLDDSRYPVAAKEEFVFNWKPEDIDTLILGDRQRGKGGMTYQEVVERFGLPSYSNIHGNDTDFDPLSLNIQYINI